MWPSPGRYLPKRNHCRPTQLGSVDIGQSSGPVPEGDRGSDPHGGVVDLQVRAEGGDHARGREGDAGVPFTVGVGSAARTTGTAGAPIRQTPIVTSVLRVIRPLVTSLIRVKLSKIFRSVQSDNRPA